MRDYSGVLLDTLTDDDELYEDLVEVPPCANGEGWVHSSATLTALMAVTRSNLVTLTRRLRYPSFDETSGEVSGYVIGGSSTGDGQIYLIFDHGAKVNVTDPSAWHWEVHFDGDAG